MTTIIIGPRPAPGSGYTTMSIVKRLHDDEGAHGLRSNSWRLMMTSPRILYGRHHRDRINTWYTGLVIWNHATELFDRVKIVERHEPYMARYRTMSYPIIESEDEETEWRSAKTEVITAWPNVGQPCGGRACDGIHDAKLCSDCAQEVEAFEADRWREYHDLIGPIPPYEPFGGYDDER